MESQPSLLSGSDCIKPGLIVIKGSPSLSALRGAQSNDLMICQLQ